MVNCSLLSEPSTLQPFLPYFDLVPSRAPRILEVSAISPESVFVKWEPIPRRHLQGHLQGYLLFYSQKDTRRHVINITVNSSLTHVTLDHMKPQTEYVVWIAGFTGKGAGPDSERKFVSTPVPGMLQLVLANYLLMSRITYDKMHEMSS